MFFVLLALFLIFAGGLTMGNLLTGAAVSLLITLFCGKYMGYDRKRFYRGLRKADEIAVYLLYLLKEIVRENFDVLRFIYRRGQPSPMLVRFHGQMQSEPLRVLVANSITLTPGTYTVKLEGDEYAVHALDKYFQVDIEYSAFFRMAREVEKG